MKWLRFPQHKVEWHLTGIGFGTLVFITIGLIVQGTYSQLEIISGLLVWGAICWVIRWQLRDYETARKTVARYSQVHEAAEMAHHLSSLEDPVQERADLRQKQARFKELMEANGGVIGFATLQERQPRDLKQACREAGVYIPTEYDVNKAKAMIDAAIEKARESSDE